MSNENQGLNERLARKKRVQRMKTGLILFVLTWMLAQMLVSVSLIAKVHSLQEQIDIITENTIRSQQVERQVTQAANSDRVQKYGSSDETEKEDGQKRSEEKGRLEPDRASVADTDSDKDKDGDKRKVYLTFDDGPSANTERILEILDQYGIKATFFVTGRDDDVSLGRYKAIVAHGNTIGMHSYSHQYDAVYESLESFGEDLELIQSRIREATGQECRLYRFPGGSSNQVSNIEMSEFIRFLNEKGITYYDWNVECGDASSLEYTTEELVANVVNDIAKHHTSVVLLHDAENKPRTVEALPTIIEQIQAMGAELLPIDENTMVIQHVSADSVGD